MIKIQTNISSNESHKNVETDKKYILRKINLKFRNPEFDIFCKVTLYHILFW